MLKKLIGFFVIVVLSISVACSFHVSYAKYFFRKRYSISFTLAEHFTFSPGETHTFQIPYDGYYVFQLWSGGGDDSVGMVAATSYFKKGENLIIAVGTRGDTTSGDGATDVRLSSDTLNDRILVADGDSSYVGEAFFEAIPSKLPDRSLYEADPKQGYAIISFIGDWE